MPRTDSNTRARTTPRGVEEIEAEGVGVTPDSALQDAFRNAVRNVVGSLVSSATLVVNDQLLLDRVITFSDGFVDYYEDIETHNEADVFHRRIKAWVRKRDLTQRVREEQKAASLDGRGLYSEVVTKMDRQKSAKAIYTETMDLFPANCLNAALDGMPRVVKTFESSAYLSPKVLLRIDVHKFQEFQARLISALRVLAVSSGTINTSSSKMTEERRPAVEQRFRTLFFSDKSSMPLASLATKCDPLYVVTSKAKAMPKDLEKRGDKSGTIFFVSYGNAWEWFLVSDKIDLPNPQLSIAIELADQAGRVLAERRIALGPAIVGLSKYITTIEGKPLATVFITPHFLDHSSTGLRITSLTQCSSISVEGELGIAHEDLRQVATVTATIKAAR